MIFKKIIRKVRRIKEQLDRNKKSLVTKTKWMMHCTDKNHKLHKVIRTESSFPFLLPTPLTPLHPFNISVFKSLAYHCLRLSINTPSIIVYDVIYPQKHRLDRRMDGRTEGRTDERTDGRTVGRMDGRTDGRSDRTTDTAYSRDTKSEKTLLLPTLFSSLPFWFISSP